MEEQKNKSKTKIYGGRFKSLEEINSGAFGTIFKAIDMETQKIIAVKINED